MDKHLLLMLLCVQVFLLVTASQLETQQNPLAEEGTEHQQKMERSGKQKLHCKGSKGKALRCQIDQVTPKKKPEQEPLPPRRNSRPGSLAPILS